MIIKKTPLLTVAVALLFPIASYANDIGGTVADPDDNQELQDVHLTTAEIVIDGDLSEWSFNNPVINPLIGVPKIGRGDPAREEGDDPSEFVAFEELGGAWTGPDDHSTTAEFVWKNGSENPDEDGLYVGVIVTDDYHENAAMSGWNGDALQMMITVYDADFEEHSASEFALYNFALGGIEGELDPENPAIVADIEQAFPFSPPLEDFVQAGITRDADAKTTSYELFFGVDAVGVLDYEEGAQFGLGMAINDGDEDSPGQTGWGGLGAHAIVFGKTPAETALLTLAPEFVGPVGPTCDPGTNGDIDGNGVIEFADFLTLSANFGSEVASHELGDVDCNGTVEFADFLTLSANFGQTVGEASSVPEPSSLGLLGFSVLFLGFLRRRRHS